MNKIIIGILILLVVLSGGLGYYSYTLSLQINSLNGELAIFQREQATQIDVINSELAAFREETLSSIGNLAGEVGGQQTKIGTLEHEIDGNLAKIDSLKDDINGTLAKIDTTIIKIDNMENQIIDTTGLSQSVIDASKVYQKVNQAAIRISNGERTIGSGFLFDNEAHVVTAYHVVENLSQIFVVFTDGRISAATVTGTSLPSDVAVLKLEKELVIEPLILANSNNVRIGEPVATIGSPFDLADTLTTGIVSQTNRFAEIRTDSQTRGVANLIQFDAAVNFGNSGGPLFNAESELIGMVIARVEPDEGDGIYYAVSSNKLKRVADSIIAQGNFDYPWLGVAITDLIPETVQTRALETANGVLVEGVLAKSPAEAAGIEVDDIIVAIDGIEVRNVADLTSYLGEHKSPGDAASITLIRNANELELSMDIGKRPS